MGNALFRAFGVNIASEVARALGQSFLPFQLLQTTPGVRAVGDLAGGTHPTTASSNCRGILDSYAEEQIDGTLIQAGDRVALLLGDTLPSGVVPKPGDQLVAEGKTVNIVGVQRDPAAATYACQVRV